MSQFDALETSPASSTPKSTETGPWGFLPLTIQNWILQKGFTSPTAIQEQAIPAALTGKDVLAQSPTGSGKTLAFSIPICISLGKHIKNGAPRAIILTPTRELGSQIHEVLHSLNTVSDLKVLPILGGSSYSRQKSGLMAGADIIVGTPGRVADLIRQNSLDLSKLKVFVLDEVDQMLDIGFAEELSFIRRSVPETVQTLFFSATLASRIKNLAKEMLKKPLEILVKNRIENEESTIKHSYIELKQGGETKALVNCLLYYRPKQAIVFCETRQETAELAEELVARGFNAAPLHGDLSQQERNKAMNRFKEGSIQYLLTTNVAARGIDVSDLPLVINYSVPWDRESYTHRTGRTGRAGKEGEAWTLVTMSNIRRFERMVMELKITPAKIAIPTAEQVYETSSEALIAKSLESMENFKPAHILKIAQGVLKKSVQPEQLETLALHLIAQSLVKLDAQNTSTIVLDRPFAILDKSKKRPEFFSSGSGRSPGGSEFKRSGSGSRFGKPSQGGGFGKPAQGKAGSFRKSGAEAGRGYKGSNEKSGSKPGFESRKEGFESSKGTSTNKPKSRTMEFSLGHN